MARRRKSRIKPWFKTTLFLLILISLGSFVYFKVIDKDSSQSTKTSSNESKDNKKNNKKEKETKKEYKASLLMVGDGLLHGYVYRDANKNGTYDFSDQLSYMKEYVKDYDIKYWNQETIFGGKDRGYSGYPRFNSPSEFGDNMIDIGFNMVSLANNHTMDQNESGILNSVAYWKTKNIVWNGQSDSEEERNAHIYGEINNIKYAMLSYTMHTNGLPVPSGKSYLVNVFDKEKVKADIEAVKDNVDVLIVAMHWGEEYTHVPNANQRETAKFLADLGVDIIIGCHPHVIQPIEKIDNTIVYYSLGNFISNQGDENKRVGLIGTLDITKTVENGNSSISINNVGGDLHYTYYTSAHSNYKVVPFSNPEIGKYLPNYQSAYEKYKKIANGGNEEFIIKPLSV
jgi:poly-gamma-glutamate synthesis protein (capsule biosynthesis protein)